MAVASAQQDTCPLGRRSPQLSREVAEVIADRMRDELVHATQEARRDTPDQQERADRA